MEEIRNWLPIIIVVITNVVTMTLAIASLRQKIAVSDVLTGEKFKAIEEKMVIKFDSLAGQIGEIKENHLEHLREDLRGVIVRFDKHLEQGK